MTARERERYLDLITSTEKQGTRTLYHVGDRFTVEAMTVTHDLKDRHDLMNLWKKGGFIQKALPTHIAVDTYYYDNEGNCWGKYNVTVKAAGNRRILDVDYIKEATPENELELVAECIKLAVEDGAINSPALCYKKAI